MKYFKTPTALIIESFLLFLNPKDRSFFNQEKKFVIKNGQF